MNHFSQTTPTSNWPTRVKPLHVTSEISLKVSSSGPSTYDSKLIIEGGCISYGSTIEVDGKETPNERDGSKTFIMDYCSVK